MRKRIVAALRTAGLLGHAEWTRSRLRALATKSTNRQFQADYPDFSVPAPDLLYEIAGWPDYRFYRDSGLTQARIFWDFLAPHITVEQPTICEWGCGVGRIIRHLHEISQGRIGRAVGTDYNSRMIDWCRSALPHVEFHTNGLMPPTSLPAHTFDAVYCHSVFTHLSEEAHHAWTLEIARILKPGGIFAFTTAADRTWLSPAELKLFDAGELVVRNASREGSRIHSAFASETFVREKLMAGREILQHAPRQSGFGQDMWLARMTSPSL